MRRLSQITANIVTYPAAPRSFGRRRAQSVFNTLTCFVVVLHQQSPTQIFISDDGDATGAIWLHRSPILIDPKDRGPFLVITLTHTLAQQKGLAPRILDWERYTPDERLMLKDATELAYRTRMRLSGQSSNRPTWHGGRNVYA